MQRIRIVIRKNPDNPANDLRQAALVRRDLWAHSPVEIDPDSSAHGTHRDAQRNAYFEFATDYPSEVERVVRDFGYADRVTVEVVQDAAGTECISCGNISPELVTVCPTCSFRDIEPCPYCNTEIARLDYQTESGDLFRCPTCHHRVRFRFTDPLFDADGHYNQPLICLSRAEAPVNHEV